MSNEDATELVASSRTGRPPTTLILPNLLARRAGECGDRPFLIEVGGGESITYAETFDRANRLAGGLQDLGLTHGDRVATLLPNSIDSVLVMCAVAIVGSIHVPLNNAYIGSVLQRAIDVSEPMFLVVDPVYESRVTQNLSLPPGCRIVWRSPVGGTADLVLTLPRLITEQGPRERDPVDHDWADVSTLLFTSGTTGGSKAVTMPWLHLYLSAVRIWQAQDLDPSLVFYSPWPINHISGTGGIYMTMIAGGSVVLREKWSTRSFVDDIVRYGCTATTLMGETVAYVHRMTGLEDSALSHVFVAPVTNEIQAAMARLGARYVTNFNSTEICSPIGSEGFQPIPAMSCGTLRGEVEVRLVDAEGEDVSDGEHGELLVRTADPAAMSLGYWGMPEASRNAWEGGWFHTGDLMRRTADGHYYFVGRLKDRLRSRGESISAGEIEAIVLRDTAVAQCAVVGRPNDVGEDDIILFVVAADRLSVAHVEAYCEAELPKFMRPREVRLVAGLPETPTGKVRHVELREALMAEMQDAMD